MCVCGRQVYVLVVKGKEESNSPLLAALQSDGSIWLLSLGSTLRKREFIYS